MIGLRDKYHGGVPTDRHLKFGFCRRAYAMSPHAIGRFVNASSGGSATFVHIGGAHVVNTATTTTCAITYSVASASNLLLAGFTMGRNMVGAVTGLSVADNRGGTWIVDSFGTSASAPTASAVARCTSVGGTGSTIVTFTYSGVTTAGINSLGTVDEFSGQSGSPLDNAPAAAAGNGTLITSPTATQSASNGLFYAALGNASSGTGSGLTAGWVNTTGSTGAQVIAYLISTDALSHSVSWTSSTSQSWSAVIVSYKHA